jgi:hypothetical protein
MLKQCFFSVAPIEQLYHQKAGILLCYQEVLLTNVTG